MKQRLFWGVFLLSLWTVVACASPPEATPTAVPVPTATPTPQETATPTPIPFPATADEIEFITIAIDAPARNPMFAAIDEFGRVQGFDPDVMANLAAQQSFDYEFVVTSNQGIFESIAQGEFDAAMSAIVISEPPPAGIVYTVPYLQVGQVIVVRANEQTLTSAAALTAAVPVGVLAESLSEQTARAELGLAEEQLVRYTAVIPALQALIDREVDALILDSEDAEQYTTTYYQQLKIVGGTGSEAWLASRSYGLAVAAENSALLEFLNEAITQAQEDGTMQRLTRTWLVEQETTERLVAGESLIGTLAQEFVLGMVATSVDLDPAANPDPIGWELKLNTMTGLVMYDTASQLIPVLATELPTISADKLEYTFRLRSGLVFPDGREFTAEDVKWSLNRAARLGNFLVNAYLKDTNVDGFADDDAVQVIDPLTIKIVLDEPAPHFLSVLATPAYYIISQNCFPATAAPASSCGGLGPYLITEQRQGEFVRLEANPQWSATPLAFENIQVRFYESAVELRSAVETGSIDLAWVGLGAADVIALNGQGGFRSWPSPTIFKSYLVFEHLTPPWTFPQVRQAAGLALDREALAALFQGARLPLYSPVPDSVPGHIPAEPIRDLERARELLSFAGYTPETPLAITIAYVSDGRYSTREAEYANLIKQQLEETNVFRVTLQGAPYDDFRQQSATCQSPAFILGWPPSGQPPYYLDATHWLNFFVYNTETLCSNYTSPAMTTLLDSLAAVDPNDLNGRLAIYGEIQTLWAEEVPTLDLTQEVRTAVSLPKVQSAGIDALGLLHYTTLTKNAE